MTREYSQPARRPIAASLLAVSLVFMGTWLAGCRGEDKGQASPPPPPPAVVVAEVIQKTVPIYAEYVGQTQANKTAEIRARVSGVLERAFFEEGAPVKAGDVLFQIDPREYQAKAESAKAELARNRSQLVFAREQVDTLKARAQLAEQKAKLAKARQDVERYKPLAARQAIPQQDLDTALAAEDVAKASVEAAQANLTNTELTERTAIELAEAAVKASEAALFQAELDLSYTTIRSPIKGITGRREVDPGNLVGRGENTLLATVSDPDPLYVNFSISETEYLMLAKRVKPEGQRGPARGIFELSLADNTVHPSRGDFGLIERALDPKTGTLTIRAVFPNPADILRPGQFGRIRVAVEERPNAILVPRLAVQEIQGAKSVLVVGPDNTVALRTITPAEAVGDLLIVRDGVKPGERVIVEGIQKARPGSKVEPSAVSAGGAPGGKAGEKAEVKPAEAKPAGKAGGK